MDPKWLEWARRLQALAQTGLEYAKSPFDVERYEELRTLASEMMAEQSGADLAQVRELFAKERGYATPKVDARGVVFRGDKVLLVRERADGRWTLPGGWADVGDTPSQAAVREVFEESGYRARAVKLLALWDRSKQGHLPPKPFHVYKVFILCELMGGEPTPSIETSEVGFFGEEEIPELSQSRVTKAQLERLFEHHRHPELPADFD